jgi:CheY-like chemotaxis protein
MRTADERPLVLVLDDDPAFLALMDVVLASEGCRTLLLTSSDGIDEQFGTHQPALAILDLQVEHEETGLAVLELVRREPATRSLPVVVCSGDADGLVRRSARLNHLGCRVIVKPVEPDDLVAEVRRALGAHRRRRLAQPSRVG